MQFGPLLSQGMPPFPSFCSDWRSFPSLHTDSAVRVAVSQPLQKEAGRLSECKNLFSRHLGRMGGIRFLCTLKTLETFGRCLPRKKSFLFFQFLLSFPDVRLTSVQLVLPAYLSGDSVVKAILPGLVSDQQHCFQSHNGKKVGIHSSKAHV